MKANPRNQRIGKRARTRSLETSMLCCRGRTMEWHRSRVSETRFMINRGHSKYHDNHSLHMIRGQHGQCTHLGGLHQMVKTSTRKELTIDSYNINMLGNSAQWMLCSLCTLTKTNTLARYQGNKWCWRWSDKQSSLMPNFEFPSLINSKLNYCRL